MYTDRLSGYLRKAGRGANVNLCDSSGFLWEPQDILRKAWLGFIFSLCRGVVKDYDISI